MRLPKLHQATYVFLLVGALVTQTGASVAVVRDRPCGPAWRVTDTPDPDPVNSPLSAIDARTASDVWAVGYRSPGAQSMHWNGSAWTTVPMPVPPGVGTMGAFDVEAIADDDVWAVGWWSGPDSGDHAFVQHWNGAAWSMVPLPDLDGVYGQLLGVDATAPDDVWAAGLVRGSAPGGWPQPLAMHFDGASWQRVPTPDLPGVQAVFDDVRVIAPDDVWAVGSRQPRLARPVGDRTLIEHWDGSSWTVVPSPEVDDQPHGLTAVDATSSDHVWAAGSIGGHRPLLEHWDGNAWSLVDPGLPATGGGGVVDVLVTADDDVWAILGLSRGGVPIHLEPSGDWALVPGGPAAGRYPLDLAATPGGELWAAGYTLGGGHHGPIAQRLCPSRPSSTGFEPATVTVPYGTAIAWTVPADDTWRRLADATGLGLFDSGPLAPTDSFTYRFAAAGTFPVAETTSDTAQTVRVRPVARSRPRLGPGTVRVTWAAEDLAGGPVADVQVCLRGGPWTPWIRGTRLPSGLYQAGLEGGRIAFRARLRAEGSSTASGWSPPAHVVPA